MAHFAELDENNTVLRVIVVGNEVIADNDSEDESLGITFCKNLLGQDGVWVQTSYNANMRKQFAGIGFKYDSQKDKFLLPQPYPSWSLDVNDDWQPPVAYPENPISEHYRWIEDTLSWLGYDALVNETEVNG